MTVGIGPPDEVQEMLTLSSSETMAVELVSTAVVFGDATKDISNDTIELSMLETLKWVCVLT